MSQRVGLYKREKPPPSRGMFAIDYAEESAKGPTISIVEILHQEYTGVIADVMKEQSRQAFTNLQASIPIHITKSMAQRYCSESMLGRRHIWKIEYYPAQVCWQCDGHLEYWDRDEGHQLCDYCTAGWVPEHWLYSCDRCRQTITKKPV